ncbi:hypothetical protein DWUX_2658 [Desulfovibrio diazotrophicus]|nr:hypothetical protein DWUX_2658 [Desulfovibrio diazotrophicus]
MRRGGRRTVFVLFNTEVSVVKTLRMAVLSAERPWGNALSEPFRRGVRQKLSEIVV